MITTQVSGRRLRRLNNSAIWQFLSGLLLLIGGPQRNLCPIGYMINLWAKLSLSILGGFIFKLQRCVPQRMPKPDKAFFIHCFFSEIELFTRPLKTFGVFTAQKNQHLFRWHFTDSWGYVSVLRNVQDKPMRKLHAGAIRVDQCVDVDQRLIARWRLQSSPSL